VRQRPVARRLCFLVVGLALVLVLVLGGGSARAEECASEGHAVVLVAFTGVAWPRALRRGVLEQLRAGLGPTGVVVCDSDDAQPIGNVATIELRQNPGERVTATIEVRDGVTEKRVARDIDLSALPDDARALGVGVAADELLRASWIELSLEGAPKPKSPPPPAVEKVVEKSLRVERERHSAVAARAALEGHTGGLLLVGGDLGFRHAFTNAMSLGVSLTVRGSERAASTHGSVSATVLGAALDVSVKLADVDAWRASLEADAWAAQVLVSGRATNGALGSEASAPMVVTRAGVEIAYRIAGPLSLSLRGGGGAVVHAVSARDYGRNVAAISGFEWYASLGPELAF
jgi:hypothetical protein